MADVPKVALVVAIAKEGRFIGKDGGLPWRIPGDIKHFKRVTMGKPCVMGRKTFESIAKPLPGRTNIVITRDPDWSAHGVEVCHSVEDALSLGWQIAVRDGAEEVCVIGGAEVYEQALDAAEVIHLTEVQGRVDGDTTFPEFNMDEWVVMARADLADDAKATHKAIIVELVRREA